MLKTGFIGAGTTGTALALRLSQKEWLPKAAACLSHPPGTFRGAASVFSFDLLLEQTHQANMR